MFAMSLIAYDIAAQLAPRNSELLKLGSQYSLGLDDVYSEQTFFSDPTIYYTVKRIAKNNLKHPSVWIANDEVLPTGWVLRWTQRLDDRAAGKHGGLGNC